MTMKIGLIGCGGISNAHRGAMANIEHAQFVAFCDIIVAMAERAQQAEGRGKAYPSIEAMLDAEALDGVVICTRPSARTEPIAAAAARGLPILCEKPPAADLETARRTEQVIRQHDASVSIAFLFRYFTIVDELRRIIADRPVAYVQSRYLGQVVTPDAIDQGLWYLIKEKSGGMIVDQGIHNLDLIRFLFGDVNQVSAEGGFRLSSRSDRNTAEDTAVIQFVTDSGVYASHAHCWGADRWDNQIEVVGAGFDLVLNLNKNILTGHVDGEAVSFEGKVNGMELEQRAWLDAIKTNNPALIRCTHADAVGSLALALAINRSIETGRCEAVEQM
jgi:myo-inositol 2-dehydrogenase/D-chiro-inositol 1-dehydrogenase